MLMRVGRRDPSAPMVDGELCVPCPVCPQPGINLPADWADDPLRQLHYARFLGGDGNFKLQKLAKRVSKNVPTYAQESMLGDAGFWVRDDTLHKHTFGTNVLPDEYEGKVGGQELNLYAKHTEVVSLFFPFRKTHATQWLGILVTRPRDPDGLTPLESLWCPAAIFLFVPTGAWTS